MWGLYLEIVLKRLLRLFAFSRLARDVVFDLRLDVRVRRRLVVFDNGLRRPF